jgi:hypothetical protein
MEDLYDQIGNYVVTCIATKEALGIMIGELSPLLTQVNYAALEVDDLKETTDKLGLGAQAITILSNIVSIYRLNTGKSTTSILSVIGMDDATVREVDSNQNYVWIPAGILLLGSGVIGSLRDSLNDGTK